MQKMTKYEIFMNFCLKKYLREDHRMFDVTLKLPSDSEDDIPLYEVDLRG